MLRVSRQRGALFVTGTAIEAIAAQHIDRVDEAARAQRVARDGEEHHVTVANKHELAEKTEAEIAKLEEDFSKVCSPSCMPVGLGLGSASHGDVQRCFHVPVLWPAIQAIRVQHSLPAHWLHVTLGFYVADIHGVPKGAVQLKPPSTTDPVRTEWAGPSAARASLRAHRRGGRDARKAARGGDRTRGVAARRGVARNVHGIGRRPRGPPVLQVRALRALRVWRRRRRRTPILMTLPPTRRQRSRSTSSPRVRG